MLIPGHRSRLREFVVLGAVASMAFSLFSNPGHAFGKKRKTPAVPADTQAYPVRVVAIGKFSESKFLLPDGKTAVDAGISLSEMAPTEIKNATKKFVVGVDSGDADIPSPRFELQGGISSFEAEVTGTGVKFGWSKSGGDLSNGALPGVNASVDVKIGKLEMDLRILDREKRVYVASAKGDAKLVGLKLEAKVNFSDFETGADFMHKSPLAAVFRAVIRKAVESMAKDAKTNFNMDWSGKVIGTNDGHVYIDKGQVDEVQTGNVFKIYSQGLLTGLVTVDRPDHDESGAKFKDDPDAKLLNAVRAGDVVKIYFK